MLDSQTYNQNQEIAKINIANWRKSNIHIPYYFQIQNFPIEINFSEGLTQLLDTMQEGRFDKYMNEIGGFTDEDLNIFINAFRKYFHFFVSTFHSKLVPLPFDTMMSHFVLYKKLLAYNNKFESLLEVGPGCGSLSFYLADHSYLKNYIQVESTQSFYLLQSLINKFLFKDKFNELAINSINNTINYPQFLDDNYFNSPDLNYINFASSLNVTNYKSINNNFISTHIPWWKIGEAFNFSFDLITSNANLNEFKLLALRYYLNLFNKTINKNGALICQCLGGGTDYISFDNLIEEIRRSKFAPVALVGEHFSLSNKYAVVNGLFVSDAHDLYSKYKDIKIFEKSNFLNLHNVGLCDKNLNHTRNLYFMDEINQKNKKIYSIIQIFDILRSEFDKL
jgi:hypothetical protein